jgi:hypothetical protein
MPRRLEGKNQDNTKTPATSGPSPRTLKNVYAKVSRAPKKIVLSLAAVAAFSPAFASAEPAPQPAHVYAVATDTVPQNKKSVKQDYAHSEARLDKIMAQLALTESGRDLIAFGQEEGIPIIMSDSKAMDDKPKDRITIKGLNYGSRYILLNGDTTRDDELMLTIVHELRHSWHERGIETSGLPSSPKQEFLKRRIQEADAFAFEIHFGYEYEKATGKTLDIGNRFEGCTGNSFPCLAEDYRRMRDSGKPVSESYGRLLEKTIAHVHSLDYDKSFLAQNDNGWGVVAERPWLGANFRAKFENTATDAEFAAAMRKVATVGTKPGVDPAALTGWTDADFLSFKKTGGESKSDVRKLDALEVKFNTARLAWITYNQPKEAAPEAQTPVVQTPIMKDPAA